MVQNHWNPNKIFYHKYLQLTLKHNFVSFGIFLFIINTCWYKGMSEIPICIIGAAHLFRFIVHIFFFAKSRYIKQLSRLSLPTLVVNCASSIWVNDTAVCVLNWVFWYNYSGKRRIRKKCSSKKANFYAKFRILSRIQNSSWMSWTVADGTWVHAWACMDNLHSLLINKLREI